MFLKAVPYSFEPFERQEYETRVRRARELMEVQGIDALLITTEANFRYFTGLKSQGWVSPTRPMFFVLPLRRNPIAVIPNGSRVIMRQSSWIEDVRTWMAPQPADDGVTLLTDALKEATGPSGKIGAELGPENQLRMPIVDFLRVQTALAPREFIDGSAVTQAIRMVKSPAEVDRIRAIAQLVSAGFEALTGNLSRGMTERDACLALQLDILRLGGDKIPYMTGASGRHGYTTINDNPSNRTLSDGDILIIDTGSTIDGYFCDFDRNFSFGRPTDQARKAHELVFAATDAGIAAAKPGVRLREVWEAMANRLGKDAVAQANVGRMGHGLGLQLTEPPSVHPLDDTLLVPGMVVTVEPGIGYEVEGERKIMVHEENLVIKEGGAELLSRRAPAEMPVIE